MEETEVLMQERGQLLHRMNDLVKTAKEEKRELTQEENNTWDDLDAKVEANKAKADAILQREERSKKVLAAQAELRSVTRKAPGVALATTTENQETGKLTRADLHRKMFREFLQAGREDNDWKVSPEYRDLRRDVLVEGGYLMAPNQMSMDFIKTVDDECFFRRLAKVMPPLAKQGGIGNPTLTKMGRAQWSSELKNATKDTTMKVGKREMRTHPLSCGFLASEDLLKNSSVDAEALINSEFARIMAEEMEIAYMLGDGFQKPLGVFVPDSRGISSARQVVCSATTTTLAGVGILDVFYSLKATYQERGSWLLHRLVRKALAKILDGQGNFLLERSMVVGQPDQLVNRPVYQSEFAPSSLVASALVMAFGDFKQYRILDAAQTEYSKNEYLYWESNQVAFKGRAFTDGAPVLEEAFAIGVMQAS